MAGDWLEWDVECKCDRLSELTTTLLLCQIYINNILKNLTVMGFFLTYGLKNKSSLLVLLFVVEVILIIIKVIIIYNNIIYSLKKSKS